MNTIISTFNDVINEFFKAEPQLVISCRLSNPLKCHLNWSNIVVDNSLGRLVRNEVINRLTALSDFQAPCSLSDLQVVTNSFREAQSGNQWTQSHWSKWIDGNCYTLSGLRMLGSLKPNETDINNRYFIITGYDEFNRPLNVKTDITFEDIIKCSLRVYDKNITKVELTDAGKTAFNLATMVKVNITPKQVHKRSTNTSLETEVSGTMVPINLATAESDSISEQRLQYVREGFVRSWTTDNYPKHILDLFTVSEVKRFGNAYCMANKAKIPCLIKGDYHNRDTASHYHYMCPDGTSLRCHDEECKKCMYPSAPIPLPEDLKQYIYINVVTNINNGTINNNYIDDSSSLAELDFLADLKKISIFHDEQKDRILLVALNGNDTGLAHLLHIITEKRWIHHRTTGWWHWDGIRWKAAGEDLLLRLIYDSIPVLLSQVKQMYTNLTAPEIENLHKKVAQIDRLKKKVRDGDFQMKVLRQAAWLFRSEDKIDITAKLDDNPYLIGFENGVYDLQTMNFRQGVPEDYISQTTGYEYTSYDSCDTESYAKRIEVEQFLESIMPNNEDRHYMLKLLSTGLLGRNPDELFHIFTGAGRNGKSKLVELLNATLGEYSISASCSFLTSKVGGAEQASPQLMTMKKARMVISSEPDHEGKLNSTIIKQLSGNDTVSGRKLYGDQQYFKPNFKMILLCNDIPAISTPDAATWMRCRCLNFPTRFVIDPKQPHERKIDKEIGKKIPDWKVTFFNILTEYYKSWLSEGLSMTANMITRTSEYQGESDLILAWLQERTEDAETNLHTCDLYSDYVSWFYNQNTGKKCVSHFEFVKGLKHHKDVKRGVWANNSGKQGVTNIKFKELAESKETNCRL
jgi:P4 family phage/plasmid primase-like protien